MVVKFALLHKLFANITKFEFQVKLMAAYSSISNGIPSDEKSFWQSYSVQELYLLYLSLSATHGKVLAITNIKLRCLPIYRQYEE